MVLKDVQQFMGVESLVDRLGECEITPHENDAMGTCFLTEDEMSETRKRKIEQDDVSEGEDDRHCKFFLTSLKAKGKSYVFEANEEYVVKYEEESYDEECDPQPRRKLRSAMKQKDGVSKEKENKKIENTSRMRSINKAAKNKRVDPENPFNYPHYKTIDGHLAFTFEGGHTVVYHMSDGENSQEKVDDDDDDDDDNDSSCVELKTNPFMVQSSVNLEGDTMESEFRQKVIDVLRKPYDKEEHDKLLSDFELRAPGWQHKELRNNRDRSCPSNRDGKSYLDHYPDLGRKLRLCADDEPKCLNLLRGLFFWLQNSVQSESFRPWQDEECLAIKPDSC